ncbi:MAG: PAS domain S-box protein, partial [Ignavibacteriales bacterium]
MSKQGKTKKELIGEIEELRTRLEEAEEALRVIRSGEVDALVISGANGEQLYTLQGAEHPYRVMVETMNEGTATLTDDGIVLYCNRRLAEILKTPLEAIIGSSILRFVMSDHVDMFEALLEQGKKGNNKGEVTLQCEDGTLTPVQLSMSALHDIEGVCVVVTDLTEQKRNEEIVSAEQLARSILDQVAEAVVVCDTEGRITRASQEAHQLCGRNPLLQPFETAFPIRVEGKEYSRDLLSTVLGGETFQGVEVNLECPSPTCPDTGWITSLIISAAPLRDAQNEVAGCVFSLTNITERKQAEEKLNTHARWQAVVAELGLRALAGADLSTLMNEAVSLVSQTLNVEYCKVLELLPDGNALLLLAGVGWKEGYVGHAIVGAKLDSQAGYTLFSKEPIIVEDLRTERRFSGPPLLHDHGVVSGISVIIHGPERPFGVMGAHTARQCKFTRDDTYFLQAVANVLAEAIQRKR